MRISGTGVYQSLIVFSPLNRPKSTNRSANVISAADPAEDLPVRSCRIDVGYPNDFAPFGDFIGDELMKISRRTTKRCATDIGEPLLHFRIGEHGVDLMVERIDNRYRVFFGAPIPCQMDASNPGTNSATAGTSGKAPERVALVTARARSLPARMFAIARGMGGKAHWT
jgi:hypothetical protein